MKPEDEKCILIVCPLYVNDEWPIHSFFLAALSSFRILVGCPMMTKLKIK
jgi:hypothetical protein